MCQAAQTQFGPAWQRVPAIIRGRNVSQVQALKDLLRARTPRVVVFLQRVRSRWARLRQGDGDVRVFERIADENAWGDPSSLSGGGSNLAQTAVIRREIPRLLGGLNARTLLDAPCGDFHWMDKTELGDIAYIGVDLVAPIIEECQARYGSDRRRFEVCDIATDQLPQADVILCRDCLAHLSYRHAHEVLTNFRASGATYLLTTTYPRRTANWDIVTGEWRPLNLTLAPFRFPQPLETIVEQSTEYRGDFADKSLGLWRLSDLPL
jgi:hypothetical protein